MDANTLYRNRQARLIHPEGSFDKQGRWYPSAAEECECCFQQRSPSRAWPYSYLTHCRTLKHCKALVAKRAAELAEVTA